MDEQELLGVYDAELQADCKHGDVQTDGAGTFCADCGKDIKEIKE